MDVAVQVVVAGEGEMMAVVVQGAVAGVDEVEVSDVGSGGWSRDND